MGSKSLFLCLLTTAGLALFAQQTEERPAFEVASVKLFADAPGRRIYMGEPKGGVDYNGSTLASVIRRAYGVEQMQLNGPGWIWTERYDIHAKMPADTPLPRMQLMLQRLLEERFKLEVHREKKEFAGFDLVEAKGGFKMTPSEARFSYSMPRDDVGRHIKGTIQLPILASVLSGVLGRPVADGTGKQGLFEISLDCTIDEDAPAPRLERALQDQLGLRLEPGKRMLEVIVVDHVEKIPVEN